MSDDSKAGLPELQEKNPSLLTFFDRIFLDVFPRKWFNRAW